MRPQRAFSKARVEGARNTKSLRAAASPQTPPSATYAELSNDNLMLRETLNNMTHGVVMFDESAGIQDQTARGDLTPTTGRHSRFSVRYRMKVK